MPEPPVEEPKNGTISDFQGLLRGPEMIIKLRQALQGGKLDQNTIQAIGEFFEKENYPLSQKQLKILHQSVASFEQHHRSAIKAKELYSQNQEELKIKTAQLFNCHPNNITGITFHDTSITVALESEGFFEQWKKICDHEGINTDEVRRPDGVASDIWSVDIEGDTLPVSIEDTAKKKDSEIAGHENLHVQYRYLHPKEESFDGITPKEYQEQLTKRSADCVAVKDYDKFRQLVREVVSKQISIYLNELSSAAQERRRDTYNQAFVDNKNFYYVIFQKRLESIRKSLPGALSERLNWEEIIDIEVNRGELQAAYIDDEYKKLISNPDYSPEMLVAIAEFLTPEQGFLISAFTEESPTYQKIKDWKKLYGKDGYVKNHEKEVGYWVGFIFRYLKISDDENESVIKAIKSIGTERTERSFARLSARLFDEAVEESSQQDSLPKIEEQINSLKELVKSRVDRLRVFLKDANLDFIPQEIDKEALRLELFKRVVDFDHVYFEEIGDIVGVKQSGSKEAEEFMSERDRIIRRSFDLDDAAEELVEALAQNNEPDYNAVFTRGFKKDNKKRERMRECLDRFGDIDTKKASPIEDDEIGLFKRLIFSSPAERSSLVVGNSRLMRRLFSACVRILLWAKENNIPQDQLTPIRTFMSESYKTRLLPTEYQDLIEDGTLNIPVSKQVKTT